MIESAEILLLILPGYPEEVERIDVLHAYFDKLFFDFLGDLGRVSLLFDGREDDIHLLSAPDVVLKSFGINGKVYHSLSFHLYKSVSDDLSKESRSDLQYIVIEIISCVMKIGIVGSLAAPEEDEATRDLPEEPSEVFGGKGSGHVGIDVLTADYPGRCSGCMLHADRIVYGGYEFVSELKIAFSSVHAADTLAYVSHPVFDCFLGDRIETSGVSLYDCGACQDVVSAVGLYLRT